MDVNDIKAGTYLLVAPFWDEYLSRPNEPFDFKRHRRGEVLELNVEDARRLVLAKAVISHDPENPEYVVNADGSISAVEKPDPALTGLVIPEDQFEALREQLGIPVDATSEDVLAAIASLSAAAQAAATGERPKSDKIQDILTWVGTDKERAQTALNGEKSTKGANARPQLTEALEKVLAAGGQS